MKKLLEFCAVMLLTLSLFVLGVFWWAGHQHREQLIRGGAISPYAGAAGYSAILHTVAEDVRALNVRFDGREDPNDSVFGKFAPVLFIAVPGFLALIGTVVLGRRELKKLPAEGSNFTAGANPGNSRRLVTGVMSLGGALLAMFFVSGGTR